MFPLPTQAVIVPQENPVIQVEAPVAQSADPTSIVPALPTPKPEKEDKKVDAKKEKAEDNESPKADDDTPATPPPPPTQDSGEETPTQTNHQTNQETHTPPVWHLDPENVQPQTPAPTPEPLSVSCSGSPEKVMIGETMLWSWTVSGGNPDEAAWSGSDKLSGKTSTLFKTYTTPGIKKATITVSKDGEEATAECSIAVVENEEDKPVMATATPAATTKPKNNTPDKTVTSASTKAVEIPPAKFTDTSSVFLDRVQNLEAYNGYAFTPLSETKTRSLFIGGIAALFSGFGLLTGRIQEVGRSLRHRSSKLKNYSVTKSA